MSKIAASVSPNDRLSAVIDLMHSQRNSCVLVTENGLPKGIFTERDVVGIFSELQVSKQIPNVAIGQVMTTNPVCVSEDMSMYDALMLARSRQLRHLPVIDRNEKLVGLVTQTDMVDAYLDLVGHQAVLESENQQLYLLSYEDSLMKIGNRRAMDVELAFTEASSRRYQKQYAVALLDVDYFKKFNDHYGHQQGDEALRALADTVKQVMRDADRVYRYGGEELLLIMPETGVEEAVVAADRIRQAVEAMQLEHSGSPYQCLTISAGVAASSGGAWSELVAKADQALYKAKHEGRNRVSKAD